ncbi:MAG: Pyridoxamine 5-phosphate oxidase-related protein [Paenibacillaceae bacterium]|jgi:nitroimidazol reductase NimA-like FMN-containing flavoprotein (pyridoxamine 5'-phosphate oxidase superfamily)|nr:Pyridoxamine 5-phosphate oxidase-related protein [Paenibacillaceae bacterium]
MEHVSYAKRDCRDQAVIGKFLNEARTGVIAIAGDEYPYGVPVNYVWHNGNIYFHGMGSGKKLRLLEHNSKVSFTVYKEHGTTTDPVPCHADTSYLSVMIFGEAARVTDHQEAAEALQLFLDKFTPGFYKQKLSPKMVEKYRSAMDGNAVAVIRITPVHLTAKENAVAPEEMFHHGQKPPGHPGGTAGGGSHDTIHGA